ncbi:glycosyl hydrolase family 88 [Paenibacillus marchantiophytorum]|uniref:Glycosyl hydrolase family 88 n=1 Tax=Paenibacillus marchantiophytorum TaxID=1619310 RepID=A0ABQ1ENS1_9BACL|nr:glycoside hydrolase family 88 protein [Paenibacillus marchantiophytorum]GFZ80278.1 glycosyl hydrolase family 88 [Paenibacillus marchantiophytorum]
MSTEADKDQDWLEETWRKTVAKMTQASDTIGSEFVHVSRDGMYDRTDSHVWTAGFWPGLLWLVYRDTSKERFRELAEQCERRLDTSIEEFMRLHHDVGFIWSLASVANYKLTGNLASRLRALKVAAWLAGRYNLRGKYIRAWNDYAGIGQKRNAGWAIIDCTMNLSLLFWASEEIGDPRFKHIASEHADTVLREFVREDGSCCHIVSFDPETGQRIEALGGQGYAPDSAWARGAAWAIYGLALCYRYTKAEKYRHGSQRVADFYLANLPEDSVPYWDFRLPTEEGAPKDSSAAAIAASGLLLLARCEDTERSRHYEAAARRMMRSLSDYYAVWDLEDEAILLHGTGNYPANKNIDVGLIYGDYFFVEALAKLRGQMETFW